MPLYNPVDTSGSQPVDSDLTAIAAVSTTAFGRALLALADAAATRAALDVNFRGALVKKSTDQTGANYSAGARQHSPGSRWRSSSRPFRKPTPPLILAYPPRDAVASQRP